MENDFFEDDFDKDFYDDFDEDLNEDFDVTDTEIRFKRSIGKKISDIRFDIDEDLFEVLSLNFSDNSSLILRCSVKSHESFIFVDEESFPQLIGAEITDVEVFEDYSGEDIFNADLECIVFKTDRGELEVHFENGSKLVGEKDNFDKFNEENEKLKNENNTIVGLIIIYWMLTS